MAKNVSQLKQVAPEFQVRRGAAKVESVLGMKHIAQAIFDTAGNDSAGVSNKTVAAHGTGVFLPVGAILTNAWYDVKTSFADGASNNATIAAGVPTDGAGCFTAAIAISDASTPWAAGIRGSVIGVQALDGNALTAIAAAAANAAACLKLTAEREITFTVAVHALTAGKLALHVEYVLGL